jgi:hypothetical protein
MGALLALIRDEPKEEPGRVVVAFARALVEKSVTVTTGPPSGFKTSPGSTRKCHPIRLPATMSAMPPIRK